MYYLRCFERSIIEIIMALSSPEKGSLSYNPLISTGATISPISVGPKLKSPARYRECLKNHAANMGGNITDGCCEFMAGGEEGTLEALKCAACQCHRNFHRKELYSGDINLAHFSVNPIQLLQPPHWPVKIANDSSSEELNFNSPGSVPEFGLGKKRFRTKFSPEQKEKMMGFAEKVGWRIPREDDEELKRFCGEIGVKRQVFKVWMHNNKNPLKKALEETNGD